MCFKETVTMKKTIAAVLALTLALTCLCSCGSDGKDKSDASLAESLISSQAGSKTANPEQSKSAFPSFKAKDVTGKTVTNKVFAKKKLTVVNIFATWSGSNEFELPALAKLSKSEDMKDVGFLGIVLDVAENGKADKKLLEKARKLYESNGSPYPYLVTDSALNELCESISFLPVTFFVDENGMTVGDPVNNILTENNFRQFINQKLGA